MAKGAETPRQKSFTETYENVMLGAASYCTVGYKSHGPCLDKKYMEAGIITFVADCTVIQPSPFSNFFMPKHCGPK